MIDNDREGRNIFRSILNILMFTSYYKLMLQLDLWYYSDACIIIKGTVNVADPSNNAYDKKLAF